MTAPEGMDSLWGGLIGFIIALSAIIKPWRDSARNTERIEKERAAREAAIKDLHDNTERKLLAVEQKMLAHIDGIETALVNLRGDIAEYRLDNTTRYLSKESGRDIVAAIEKLDNRVRDGFKDLDDKLGRKVDK